MNATEGGDGGRGVPAARELLAAVDYETANLSDIATGQLIVVGKEHAADVTRVQSSPDGKRLLTVGADAFKVWTVTELMKATGK